MSWGPQSLRLGWVFCAALLPGCQCFHPVCGGHECEEIDGGNQDGGADAPDAGDAQPDAGTRDGGSSAIDAGPQRDAGSELDGGQENDAGTLIDAGGALDAGGQSSDAGGELPDAGSPLDAGGPPPDSGDQSDAGGQLPDAGLPVDAGWQLWTVTTSPPARTEFMMTYDIARDRVVVFGGVAPQFASNDTWEWDGTSWQPIATPVAPPSRYASEIAYDPNNQFTVLFSGDQGFLPYPQDTWVYRGGDAGWTSAAVVAPPGRRSYAMAYDLAQQAMMLYGGWAGGSSFLTDTWQWDGGSSGWVERATTGPPATFRPAMAFDEARGEMVLYGGSSDAYQTCPNSVAETWTWNDATGLWTQRMPAHSPPALAGHTMVYDSRRQRIVMFAGCSNVGFNALNANVWEWDGTDWTQVPVIGPQPRWLHGMAFQTATGTAIVFGGIDAQMVLNDTWEYFGP